MDKLLKNYMEAESEAMDISPKLKRKRNFLDDANNELYISDSEGRMESDPDDYDAYGSETGN